MHRQIARPSRGILVAWLGTFVVISATWNLFASQAHYYAFASLGGSAVIVFGMPDSVMAQPRSLFGGHALGATCGVVFLFLFGNGPWAIAAAVATALAAMQYLNAIHSPAGADPIIVMSGAMSLPLVAIDLAVGLLFLWLLGIFLLNLFAIRPYGQSWRIVGPVAKSLWGRALRSTTSLVGSLEPPEASPLATPGAPAAGEHERARESR